MTAAALSGDLALRLSRLVSNALAPVVSIFLICFLASVVGAPESWTGVGWGILLGVLCAVVPIFSVKVTKTPTSKSGEHPSWKRKRWIGFAVSAASLALCMTLAAVLHAPGVAIWALCTMIVGLAASSAITAAGVKVSMHAFCSISLLLMMSALFSWWWLWAAAAMGPLMLYSRVRLGEHTVREVVVGSLLAVALVPLASLFVPPAG